MKTIGPTLHTRDLHLYEKDWSMRKYLLHILMSIEIIIPYNVGNTLNNVFDKITLGKIWP